MVIYCAEGFKRCPWLGLQYASLSGQSIKKVPVRREEHNFWKQEDIHSDITNLEADLRNLNKEIERGYTSLTTCKQLLNATQQFSDF